MTVYVIVSPPGLELGKNIRDALKKLPNHLRRSKLLQESGEDGGNNKENKSDRCSYASMGELLKNYVSENWDKDVTITSEQFPELLTTCAIVPLFKRPQVQGVLFNGPLPLDIGEEEQMYYNYVIWGDDGDNSSTESTKFVDYKVVMRSCSCHKGLDSIREKFCVQLCNVSVDAELNAVSRLTSMLEYAPRRPGWDIYFMQMAVLVSSRSNCLKRCVGSVIVRDRRIVSTGYNGTPFGVKNCIDGGCTRCSNTAVKAGEALDICTCMHAEANALMEAGRNRTVGGTLYVTLHPCLNCCKLICQAGIEQVFYLEEYQAALEDRGLKLLNEVGISCLRLEDPLETFVKEAGSLIVS